MKTHIDIFETYKRVKELNLYIKLKFIYYKVFYSAHSASQMSSHLSQNFYGCLDRRLFIWNYSNAQAHENKFMPHFASMFSSSFQINPSSENSISYKNLLHKFVQL